MHGNVPKILYQFTCTNLTDTFDRVFENLKTSIVQKFRKKTPIDPDMISEKIFTSL